MPAKLLYGKGEIWPRITKLARGTHENVVAVAFVATDASDLLPLKRGDTLVVDMSPFRVRGGATNPHSVRKYFNKGVKVWTCDGLHAKVFVLGNRLVIGSTNVSNNSESDLEEAALETNDRDLIEKARDFILGLTNRAETQIVDRGLLNRLEPLYRPRGFHSGTPDDSPRVDWVTRVMQEIAPASVVTGHGRPFIDLSKYGAVRRIYLSRSGDTVQLRLHPADTKEQAEVLYDLVSVHELVMLQNEGWKIYSGFHLGFWNTNLRGTNTRTNKTITQYLNFWRHPPQGLDFKSAREPNDYPQLINALLQNHLMQPAEVGRLQQAIANRPWLSLRPGIGLSFAWEEHIPTAAQILHRVNEALATWKERVVIRGLGNARRAVVQQILA